VDSNYVIVGYGYNDGYLVRKSDGAVFSLKNVGLPSSNNMFVKNNEAIFTDNGNNIYYISGEKVIKINVQNPRNITKETYSPSNDSISVFIMDKSGNIFYYGRDNASNEISRIKMSNGGLKNFDLYTGRTAWLGWDNNLYYYEEGVSRQIKKVVINIPNITITDFGDPHILYPGLNSLSSYRVRINNRVIYVCESRCAVFEFYPTPALISENSNETDYYLHFPLASINGVGCSDNYYYIVGNNSQFDPVLLKINATNDSYTTLASGYDIYKFTVSSNDVVTFNALRMSDGAKVIGEISASGQLRILDSTLNSEVVALERIR
jgi:hypothetical protein